MSNQEIQKLQRQGYGYRKIANILGLSENSVKSYIRRHPFASSKKICLQCGKELEMIPHKREKKFCSDKCRMVWWNSHKEQVNKKAIYNHVCMNCGAEFQSYGNKNRKYCSRACYANARRKGDKCSG